MKKYIRVITEKTTLVETCSADSSKIVYVDRDKRKVSRYGLGNPVIEVVENWREMNDIELAILAGSDYCSKDEHDEDF